MIRAEAQISGGADEDDAVDEELFLQESLELHFNISEVIGSILRTHGSDYLATYMNQWNEIITDLSRPYCIKEDRQFSLYVVSDVVEYALTDATAAEYLSHIMPILIETTGDCVHTGPRQAASYILGVAAGRFPIAFGPYISDSLSALSKSIQMGEEAGEFRGPCTDNSVSAVGAILAKAELLRLPLQYDSLWDRWIRYLPIRGDLVNAAT